MKLSRNVVRIATIGLMAFALAGCATHDRKTNNTLVGAGLGAATGAVFSGGDPLYTLGGAAAGGVLGNVLTPERSYSRSRASDRGRNQHTSRQQFRGNDKKHANHRRR